MIRRIWILNKWDIKIIWRTLKWQSWIFEILVSISKYLMFEMEWKLEFINKFPLFLTGQFIKNSYGEELEIWRKEKSSEMFHKLVIEIRIHSNQSWKTIIAYDDWIPEKSTRVIFHLKLTFSTDFFKYVELGPISQEMLEKLISY
jgi:hypothetical protein